MKVAVYIGKNDAKSEERLVGLIRSLEMGGCEHYMIEGGLLPDTDMVLSVGGDGTFLSVSKRVADSGIPVVGVNLGRIIPSRTGRFCARCLLMPMAAWGSRCMH